MKKKIEKNFNTGLHQLANKQYKEAIISFSQCISLGQKVPEVYSNRGIAYNDLGLFADAIRDYSKAIQLNPDYVEARCNLGVTLNSLERYKDASIEFKRVIRLRPSFATAYLNLGISLHNLSMYDEALQQYDLALKINSNNELIHHQKGITFVALKKFEEAFTCYDKAISLNQNYIDAYIDAGMAFVLVKNFSEALAIYDQGITINDRVARLYILRAVVLKELKMFDEALSSIYRGLEVDADYNNGLEHLITLKREICNWDNHDSIVNSIKNKIRRDLSTINSFVSFNLYDDPLLLKKSALLESSKISKTFLNNGYIKKFTIHQKIRLGFFSSDFQEHPIAHLMSELIEIIDRTHFEVIAFSFGIAANEEKYKARLIKGFDKFIDAKDLTNLEIVSLSRAHQIDIAIDLNGHTLGSRTKIFADRVAPIQVNFLGFLGSMGANFIDYIIADSTLIPTHSQDNFTEKIIYLPSYQPNDSKRIISDKLLTRKMFGLNEDTFVYCCFNNSYKISPMLFSSWMRILQEAPKSALWLAEHSETAKSNLKKEAELRNIDPDRLVFSKNIPLPEYLSRFRLANIFLDTYPYNAGTVGSDALRMGLPVLTMAGNTFSSRMCSSLLLAVNMPELITHSLHDYESLAIELYKDKKKYSDLRDKLKQELPQSKLFDIKRYTLNFERALKIAYERLELNQALQHIIIND